MKNYALYCNGKFVMAKPMFHEPKSPSDFCVAELPTSCYDIVLVEYMSLEFMNIKRIPATIDVGAVELKVYGPVG